MRRQEPHWEGDRQNRYANALLSTVKPQRPFTSPCNNAATRAKGSMILIVRFEESHPASAPSLAALMFFLRFLYSVAFYCIACASFLARSLDSAIAPWRFGKAARLKHPPAHN
jgi:hypothetical protein